MDIEKALEVSDKLEKARKSIKFLFGDKYEEKIQPWKNLIINVSKKYKISSLQSALKLCTERSGNAFGVEDGMTSIIILSAACDLAEDRKH